MKRQSIGQRISSPCSWKRGITRDPDALAALFDEDAEFVNVTGLWWHTRDEIRSVHAYGLTRIFKDSWLRATDVRVKRLSDEIAVVHARMPLSNSHRYKPCEPCRKLMHR